ncbi:MAG: sigma-70 family RNA polymerase sigma factor [Candidatus Latescibacteria bacterium]|nr:sigma-70 family RNA polymerase sigma factor [Candidatus Latescibacterota bacterium]
MEKTLTDRQLVERVRTGHSGAFDILLERHLDTMRAISRSYLRHSADSDDAVQAAAVQAFQQLERLDDPGRFLPWLHAIVRNCCLSSLRTRRHFLSYEEETEAGGGQIQVDESYWSGSPFPDPDQELLEREEARWLQGAVDQLPEKNRSVTALHYYQGKTYEEMAAVLEVPLSTIEGRLYRARKQLKEVLVNMAKADIDQVALEEAITDATKGLQEDIDQIKSQLRVINWEDNHWLSQARSSAGQTITKLPTDQENPVVWGLAGAYRLGAKVNKRRLSFMSYDDIDEYLATNQDVDIARFAALFADPAAVGVIRQLVKGPRSAAELTKGTGIEPDALERVLEGLVEALLVRRGDDGRIEPVKDTVPYFMTLISLSQLYRVQIGELDKP